MQTFLPYESFEKSARCLDYRRLGKQRVENMQIMKTIATGRKAWKNHPAVKMWQDYPWVLLEYQCAIVDEWTRRGYKDTCQSKTETILIESFLPCHASMPFWIGSQIHSTHRSNLFYKKPDFYGQYDWSEAKYPRKEYYWPGEIK